MELCQPSRALAQQAHAVEPGHGRLEALPAKREFKLFWLEYSEGREPTEHPSPSPPPWARAERGLMGLWCGLGGQHLPHSPPGCGRGCG